MAKPGFIRIEDKDYELDSLSDLARTHINNVRMADQEIARLRNQLALAETARKVFVQGLVENLPAEGAASEPATERAAQQRTVVLMLLRLRVVSPQPPSAFWVRISHWIPPRTRAEWLGSPSSRS